MKLVEADGTEVVLASVDGTFFAFGNECNHVGGALEEGDLEGDTVTCRWHGAVFNVKSGEAVG